MRWKSLVLALAVVGSLFGALPAARASQPAASLSISPRDAVIYAGQSQAYEVTAYSASGRSLGPVPARLDYFGFESDNPPFGNVDHLYPSGGCAGSICGPFTDRGTQHIQATYEGVTVQTSLRVLPGWTDHVNLYVGGYLDAVQAGSTIPVDARYEDRYGNFVERPSGDIGIDIVPKGDGGGSSVGAACDAAAKTCRATDDGSYFVVASTSDPGAYVAGVARRVTVVPGPMVLKVTSSQYRVSPRPLPDRVATITARFADEFGNLIEPFSTKASMDRVSESIVLGDIHDPEAFAPGSEPATLTPTVSRLGEQQWQFEAGHYWGDYVVSVSARQTYWSGGDYRMFIIKVSPNPVV